MTAKPEGGALAELDRAALLEAWRATHGRPPLRGLGRARATSRLDEEIEHLALIIDRLPQPVPSASNLMAIPSKLPT